MIVTGERPRRSAICALGGVLGEVPLLFDHSAREQQRLRRLLPSDETRLPRAKRVGCQAAIVDGSCQNERSDECGEDEMGFVGVASRSQLGEKVDVPAHLE